MVRDLIKIANRLDTLGLKREADGVDSLIKKIAGKHRDKSEDPGDWSESKWEEWDSQAGTFGNKRYTVVQLYKMDGETPVLKAKHEMVGGTQEDPELEWIKSKVIIPVKGDVGDIFDLKEDSYSMTKSYEIVELGTEDSPGKAVRVK